MVILHVKRSTRNNEFLFSTTVKQATEDTLDELVTVHNLRLKVLRLAMTIRELAKHGPIRPEETRGLSDASGGVIPLDPNAYGKPTNPDEHGYRTGVPPAPEIAKVLMTTCDSAEAAADFRLVAQKVPVTREAMEKQIAMLRGAVMIAYPQFHRLPHYDPARLELEDKEELDGASELQDVLDKDQASLWFAGKEILPGKVLEEYVGRNEKTKVIAKLQQKGAGAPVREPRIDDDTHKAMLSYYYKKQEENKRLMADDEDNHLDAAWANPKALKQALVGGGGNVTWKGGR